MERDQRALRGPAPPVGTRLAPEESRRLQSIEQQERLRLRDLRQRQERERRALLRRERIGPELPGPEMGAGPGAAARLRGLEMQQRRALEGERLRRRIERRTLPAPYGAPVWPPAGRGAAPAEPPARFPGLSRPGIGQ